MIIREFTQSDLSTIKIQTKQSHVYDYLSEDYSSLSGVTLLDGDTILFCGGLQHLYSKRYVAWSVWSEHSGAFMFQIVRRIKNYFDLLTNCRIECTCDVSFPQAHRLVKMLGFELEAPCMKMYEIDGRSSSLYSLIRN